MDIYTDKELKELNKLKDDLIIWMYHNPNDSHPIMWTIKEAYKLGKKIKQKEVVSR